jgi:hypothetical protein
MEKSIGSDTLEVFRTGYYDIVRYFLGGESRVLSVIEIRGLQTVILIGNINFTRVSLLISELVEANVELPRPIRATGWFCLSRP